MAGDAPGDRLGELAQVLQAHCLEGGATVALAESCTGGMVASALTDIAGSSGYLLGGVVAYSDAAKRELLGVDRAVLAAHGAVSAQVARAMAIAARERFAATIGASVTGIAGPGGATASKPIGLTYVGVADGEGAEVRRIVWSGDRAANRRDSAVLVLEVLLERLGAPLPPPASDPISA
jgi:PncC family amidohydrolase